MSMDIDELLARLDRLHKSDAKWQIAGEAAAAIRQLRAGQGEPVAWFVERRDDRSFPAKPYKRWLAAFDYEECIWTNDPLEAIRFCRKEDADKLCRSFGLPEIQRYSPFPSEHIFIGDTSPPPAQGMVSVPEEPTQEMLDAAEASAKLNGGWDYVSKFAIYRAMIAAARPQGAQNAAAPSGGQTFIETDSQESPAGEHLVAAAPTTQDAKDAQIAALKNDIVLQRNGYTGMVDALEAKLEAERTRRQLIEAQHSRLCDEVYEEDGETLKHTTAEAAIAKCFEETRERCAEWCDNEQSQPHDDGVIEGFRQAAEGLRAMQKDPLAPANAWPVEAGKPRA